MKSAQEITAAKRLFRCTDVPGCGQAYGRRYLVQAARMVASYTITSVTYVSGPLPAANTYVSLIDGGAPAAVVFYDGATFTLVNRPSYVRPPPTTVLTAAGAVFTIAPVSSSCCSCSN